MILLDVKFGNLNKTVSFPLTKINKKRSPFTMLGNIAICWAFLPCLEILCNNFQYLLIPLQKSFFCWFYCSKKKSKPLGQGDEQRRSLVSSATLVHPAIQWSKYDGCVQVYAPTGIEEARLLQTSVFFFLFWRFSRSTAVYIGRRSIACLCVAVIT